MKSYSSRELIKIVESHGWIKQKGRGKGDHFVFKKPGAPIDIVIYHPVKDVKRGTAHKILKQARAY
ncbi:hypothetical protein BAMA_16505 [Bacillus manliponensis]|uniref:Toxin HicA n=1 Tax=Bacillus manliponensis TaxID=574376 RepID=A0A073JQ32_9BACI|nr:type II toxin-antitoxin system HicA family toxin [Bacillus manliponensis]KEK17194.1 hypothetical protein BAMA_16505 [Bacillus manliponensis]